MISRYGPFFTGKSVKKSAVVTVCMAGGVRARVPRARDEAAAGGRAAARAPAAAAARAPPRESRPHPTRPHLYPRLVILYYQTVV